MDLTQQMAEVAPHLSAEVIELITDSIKENSHKTWQLFGFCVSAISVLGGFCWFLLKKVQAQEGFGDDLGENTVLLNNIHDHLVGTLDTKGLVTKHHDLEKRVGDLETKEVG